MKNKPLSDLKIKNAKTKEKDYQLGDQYGLYLLVKTTGNKLWQMRYTSPTTKRRNIASFGKYCSSRFIRTGCRSDSDSFKVEIF